MAWLHLSALTTATHPARRRSISASSHCFGLIMAVRQSAGEQPTEMVDNDEFPMIRSAIVATITSFGLLVAVRAEATPAVEGHVVKRVEANGQPMRRLVMAGDGNGGWAWNGDVLYAVDRFGTVTGRVEDYPMDPEGAIWRDFLHPSKQGRTAIAEAFKADSSRELWRIGADHRAHPISTPQEQARLLQYPSDDHAWLSLLRTSDLIDTSEFIHVDLDDKRTSFMVRDGEVLRAAGDGARLWCLLGKDKPFVLALLDVSKPGVVQHLVSLTSKETVSFGRDGNVCWVIDGGSLRVASIQNSAEPVFHAIPTPTGVESIFPAGNHHAVVCLANDSVWLVDASGHMARLNVPSTVTSVSAADDELSFWIEATDGTCGCARLYLANPLGHVIPLGKANYLFVFMRSKFDLNPYDLTTLRTSAPPLSAETHQTVYPTNHSSAIMLTEEGIYLVDFNGHSRKLRSFVSREQRVFEVFPSKSRNYFWITGDGPSLFVVRSDGAVFDIDASTFPSVAFGSLSVGSDGRHVLTTGGRANLLAYSLTLIDSASGLARASVDFAPGIAVLGSKRINLDHSSAQTMAIDPTREQWKLSLDWPGREDRASAVGMITAQLDDGTTARAFTTQGSGVGIPQWTRSVHWSKPYKLSLVYADAHGTQIHVDWPAVTFDVPLLRRVGVRSVLCALMIILLALLVGSIPRIGAKGQSWAPALLSAATAISAQSGSIEKTLLVDGPLVALCLGIAFVAAVPLGLVSPVVFRRLAAMQPFRALVPLLLAVPSLRGRIYADYVRSVEKKLKDAREDAFDETYCEVPATTVTMSGVVLDPVLASPARVLVDMVCATDPRKRANVTIEATGGRGKSAVLREAVRIALERYAADDRIPMPILCDSSARTIEEAVMKAIPANLGADVLLDQLRAGHFFIVLDSLSESSIEVESLKSYFAADYALSTPLLIATRPSLPILRAVRDTPRFAVIEPSRLTDDTLPLFESRYGRGPGTLSESQKRACRAADGTYLPLLIRLALRTESAEAHTVTQLYETTFLQGGDREEAAKLLDGAAALGVETYWRDGYRTMSYSSATDNQRTLLDRLMLAGLVLKVGSTINQFTGEAREVRFFHDSMQSYLTARGLFQANAGDASWRCLERAAGDPRFVRAGSDLIAGTGSELFQFCIEVFTPREKLRTVLTQHIQSWAAENDGDLKKNEVVEAARQVLGQGDLASTLSSGPFLLEMLACVMRADGGESVEHLAALYQRVAPLVWQYRRTDSDTRLPFANYTAA